MPQHIKSEPISVPRRAIGKRGGHRRECSVRDDMHRGCREVDTTSRDCPSSAASAVPCSSMRPVRRFFAAVGRDWTTRLTGVATIPLTVIALYANTSTQRAAWATVAVAAFVISAYRVWHAEYVRAESAEALVAGRPRPWVIIDKYGWETHEDENTGEEYDVETLHLVNRGDAAAINITVPPLRVRGRTAEVFRQPPTLGPGDSAAIQIHGLRASLDTLRSAMSKLERKSITVRLPFPVEYKDLSQQSWETNHAVSFGGSFVAFKVVVPGEPHEWTELAITSTQS